MKAIMIANTILKRAWGKGIYVNPLKLQSLLYFTQGFCLKYDCDGIIDEDFYKNERGAIIYSIDDVFKKYLYDDIKELEKGRENHIYTAKVDANLFFIEILDHIIAIYGNSSYFVLFSLIEYHNKIRDIKIKTGQIMDKTIIKKTFEGLNYGE